MSNAKSLSNYYVVSIDTTSDSLNAHLVRIAIKCLDGSRGFTTFIRPREKIQPSFIRLHGIQYFVEEDVMIQENTEVRFMKFHKAMRKLAKFLKNKRPVTLIAHDGMAYTHYVLYSAFIMAEMANEFKRIVKNFIDVDDIMKDLYPYQRNRSTDNMCKLILNEPASKDSCYRTDQIIHLLLTHSKNPEFYHKYKLTYNRLLLQMRRENLRAPVFNKNIVKFFKKTNSIGL